MFLDKSQFDLNAPAEPEHPEQTGPKRFLEIIQAEFLNLVKLNLLLLLCCLPVVTLPPALFAVHCLIRRMVLGKPVSCWQDYWGAFRSGWKRAYGAFCLTALPMGLAGYGASFYLLNVRRSLLLILPFSFCAMAFLIVALSSPYLYGLLADGRPLKAAVRPALVLGVARPLRGALGALCWYGLTALGFLALPFSGVYLVLIGFTFPFLLGSFYVRTVLGQVCGA